MLLSNSMQSNVFVCATDVWTYGRLWKYRCLSVWTDGPTEGGMNG